MTNPQRQTKPLTALTRLLAMTATIALGGCVATALQTMNTLSVNESVKQFDDLGYGDDERHTFDLYLPEEQYRNRPLILFVYGGAWQFGHASQYRWVAESFNALGYPVAIPDYRLFPDVTFPAFVNDVAQALPEAMGSCQANGFCRTGDVVLIGHSAGAHTVSMLALDERYLGDERQHIVGWVGLSGPYDFLPLRDKLEEIFPPEIDPYETQPINFVSADDPPALLIHGKIDSRVAPENSHRLARALEEVGVAVESRFLDDTRHAAVVFALSERFFKDLAIRQQIAEFLDRVAPASEGQENKTKG